MTEKKFNPDKAHMLMSDDRKALLPPDDIIKHLNLRSADVVADLGAGNGYFAIPIAKYTNNTLYAVDIEPKMLDMLKENATKEGIRNINYVVSDLESIQLNDDSVNKAIASLVIHEVTSLDIALSEIKRILKPGGQLLLIEWEAIQTESGPPLHERIPSKAMLDILMKYGFEVEVTHLNSVHYAVNAVLS
ncbi:class I SAM-dependent methyltransferase [Aquibacillus sp. 3ASR75-11]|uniref:Class I SAM-dependent methyltransferase n=1 Tax=Terrihalobacillus insolitus TaxID=2950438 RepID=A0A9X4ALF9_9BACI|nr:class I SAM-dependent methyltransferase [Terrihalobacillus insolitus]MDC3424342.1 class I SAM-dependent methyltransferase [Terrihalobacillus insolitus]